MSLSHTDVAKRRSMAAIRILARGDPMHSIDDRMSQIGDILKDGVPNPKPVRRRTAPKKGKDRMETGGEKRADEE